MHDIALQDTRVVLVQVVFWICLLHVIGVSTFWPWWQHSLGQSIIYKTAAISAILLPTNLYYVFHIQVADSPAWQWYSVVCFGVIGVMVVWRFIALYQEQRKGRRKAKS
jgi:hypothetical protein